MGISHLFARQKQYFDYFFRHLDEAQAERFFSLCLETRGMIVLTGVGKSGIVAEKIAMTLISTGTRAMYLPALSIPHGDLGVFTSDDLLICLSKSGETEELLALIPLVRKRNARLAAIVSRAESRLARYADCFMQLPVEKELCPFDLAPTTSTVLQLAFGDALAVALMEARKISLSEYAASHPAGSIGKKATMRVEELMWKGGQLPLARGDHLLQDALHELTAKKCGCLLIVDDEEKFAGIFTDGDLRRALQHRGPSVMQQELSLLMTASAMTVSKDVLAWDALKIMQKDPGRWIAMLPVIEDGRAIGLLRMHDIVQAGIG